MEKRVYNFSPGPAVLPLPVLQEAQRDLIGLPGTGISILEISHRSKTFDKIINQAEANLAPCWAFPTTTGCCSSRAGQCSSSAWWP